MTWRIIKHGTMGTVHRHKPRSVRFKRGWYAADKLYATREDAERAIMKSALRYRIKPMIVEESALQATLMLLNGR